MDGRPMAAPASADHIALPVSYYDPCAAPVDPYHAAYAHHLAYPVPQPPPPSHQARAAILRPDQQKIHTLYVSHLPKDVSAREIHNLFRLRSGFQTCQLKFTGRGNQVVAFATFYDHYTAVAAMNQLNGRLFDPETGATLRVELARSNSRIRVPKGPDIYSIIDERNITLTRSQEVEKDDGDSGSESSDEPSDTDNSNPSLKDDSIAATQSGEVAGSLDNDTVPVDQIKSGVPECSTLFIANLGPTCTEEELKEELFKYQGFRVVRMRSRGSMPVAFADFLEVEDATNAMKGLQDCLLPSSDRGKLHVEYAKSKMRK